ncbi:MAG: hypothetical protein ACXWFG_15495 [Methylobacter sp.]
MNKCSVCGHERDDRDMKCPECGSFYSKIDEIIVEQEALDELKTFRGRCKKIFNSGDVKQELLAELRQIRAGLTNRGMFALFVVFVFVFALVISVL